MKSISRTFAHLLLGLFLDPALQVASQRPSALLAKLGILGAKVGGSIGPAPRIRAGCNPGVPHALPCLSVAALIFASAS